MTDIWTANALALIAFSLVLIAASLVYIAFKDTPHKDRSHPVKK